MKACPKAREVAAQFGQKEFPGPPSETVDRWRACLQHLLSAGGRSQPADITQWPCPLEDNIWDEWLRAAGDLEKSIGTSARRGVPLGIEVRLSQH